MKYLIPFSLLAAMASGLASAGPGSGTGEPVKGSVKLMTLDPGHFHASLVQKFMNQQLDPVVHVYAPEGEDLQGHLQRIESFNTRPENPTQWVEKLHTGPDFLERMIQERPGNMVVISGNNGKKTRYIMDSVSAGFNVLADKPMAITPADFDLLKKAFATAAEKGVLLYDIMTERSEITTVLQKELSLMPEIFGTLQKGSPEQPAVTKESVHYWFKEVAGKPLKRPAWFFDTTQQGEGIVDVTTHLVDLVQWECFPAQILDGERDVRMLSARRWITRLTPAQFKKVTQLDEFPAYLKKDVAADGVLDVYANGEMVYTLKGVHAKVSVEWGFEAPPGTKDTHYSMMRGTKANLIIKQGQEQNYKVTLYVENTSGAGDEAFEKALRVGIAKINATWPGVDVKKAAGAWEIMVPQQYDVGHEHHFSEVAARYLRYLADGKLPEWEVPNMIAKYYTIMQGYQMSR